MLDVLAALGVGYLLGALPSADLLARLRGVSIFEVGSGNMGAMNSARNLGFAIGVTVLLLDLAKGALATLLGLLMVQLSGPGVYGPLAPPLAAGVGAVLGHAFSVYVGFRGGKALATTFGISLPLYPLAGLYGLLLLLALLLLLRRVTVASIAAIALYPAVVLLALGNSGWPRDDVFLVVTSLLPVAAVVIVRHVLALRRPTGSPERGQRGDSGSS